MMVVHWRLAYDVHPGADCFPPLSDEDLKALGEDIKANGLKSPIVFFDPGGKLEKPILLDGINRLEAMHRAGINWRDEVAKNHKTIWQEEDAVAYIISANILRRHLTKQERADIIVALAKARIKKPGRDVPVSDPPLKGKHIGGGIVLVVDDGSPRVEAFKARLSVGGRGKKNPVKEQALSINRELPKEQRVSERTIKRSIAKAEGRLPEPSRIAGPKLSGRPTGLAKHVGIDAARRYYLERCAEPDVDLDAEQEIILDALREIAGKRAMATTARAASAPDYPPLPDFLDRRQR